MLPTSLMRVVSLGLVSLLLSGCFHAAELAQVRADIEREVPEADFDKELELTVGPMSLGFVRLLTAFVPAIREERGLLKEIDRIKVAKYRVRSMPPIEGFQPPWQIRRLLEREDWEVAVKAREQEEVFWLLYRIHGEAVRDLFVIGLNARELFLVDLEGRLDQLVAHAVEMRPESISGLLNDQDWDNWGEMSSAGGGVHIHTRDVRNATLPDFWEVEQEGFYAGYNRVDGLWAGLLLPPSYRGGRGLHGQFVYAFGGKYFRHQVGLEVLPFRWLNRGWPHQPRANLVSLGAEVHDLTSTQDDWILSDEENSLAALLVRRDFHDHYRRTGWSAYLAHDAGGVLRLAGRFVQDDFDSLVNSVDWSIFRNSWARRSFRPNPAVDELQLNSLRAELELDTRNHPIYPGQGWHARGLLEKAGGSLGGDGSFRRGTIDVARYQTLGPGLRFDLRARAGTADGELPRQYLYDLGGISTLRGFGYKQFTGDRMVLFNAECWVDVNQFWNDYWFLDGVNMGGFIDAGSAWFGGDAPVASATAGHLYERDIKTSAGWGIDLEDFRLYLAKPIGSEGEEWDISFRISRTF